MHAAFGLHFHDARFHQHAHVLRDGHERHIERNGEVRNRAFPGTGELSDNPPPDGVRQRKKNRVNRLGLCRVLSSAMYEIFRFLDIAAECGDQLRRADQILEAHHLVRRMHVTIRH